MIHEEPMTIRTNARSRRSMVLSLWRWASATLFATTLAMCTVPTGCAATDAGAETPPQPLELSPSSEPSLAPSTEAAFQACVNEGVSRLSRNSYDVSFEVDATPKGVIRGVESKGKRLDDAKIEACMIRAVRAMPVRDLLPPDDSLLDDSVPASSQRVLPSARNLLGNTAVLPQVLRLAPVVLTASGVTIVVTVVVIVAVVAVAATMSEECQQEWRDAKDKCAELLELNDPPHDVTGGYVNTKDCARGLVRQSCGGNRYDGNGQPARPGRRT